MRRRLALVLLGLGVVLGYASGFHALRHGHHHWGYSCYPGERSWLFGY